MNVSETGRARAAQHCWEDVLTEEIRTLYPPSRSDTRLGAAPALLAVDLYAVVFPDGPVPVVDAVGTQPRSCGIYAWQAMPRIEALLRWARRSSWPVIFTTSERARGDFAGTATTGAFLSSAPRDRPEHFQVHPRFAPLPDEQVIYKSRASAFFGTDLADRLAGLGIDTVVLCGESTSGCVRASTVDAFSHGLHVVVAEDAVFDRNLLSHKVSLFDMHHKYADVMTVEEIALRSRGKGHTGA
jgi:nicotinamidase-related amidase